MIRYIDQFRDSERYEEERKRKMFNDQSDVVCALLSLDSKRFKTAIRRCSSVESDYREVSTTPLRMTLDDRRDAEESFRENFESARADGTVSSRLNQRIQRFDHKVDHNELSSAMALASLANSPPLNASKAYCSSMMFDHNYSLKPQSYRAIILHDHPSHEFRRPDFRNYILPHQGHYRYVQNDPHFNVSALPTTSQMLYQRNDSFRTFYDHHECVMPQERSLTAKSKTSNQCLISNTLGAMDSRDDPKSQAEENESKYFQGVIPLGVQAADREWLSELYCYVRTSCVEAFSANDDDVRKSSKRGRIIAKQVGIRCKFCAHTDLQEQLAMSAVSYPVSLSGIHESVKRWIKIHLCLCKYIPTDIKNRILDLETSSSKNTRRQYWVDSAKALGIEDTVGGLRFTRDVQHPGNITIAENTLLERIRALKKEKETELNDVNLQSNRIVFPEDADQITPFLYNLLCEVEPCRFTEVDKYLARSKCIVGFHGFQCRHCSGIDGGKYFPISKAALATNSTTQNVFSHLLKCNKCPNKIKEKLKQMKSQQNSFNNIKRSAGWRQEFFSKIWNRLHGSDGSDEIIS